MRWFQHAAEKQGTRQPHDSVRLHMQRAMKLLPVWYPAGDDDPAYPLHVLSRRPMAMYYSWGSQDAWLRQLHGVNPLYVPRVVWEAQGFDEEGRCRLTSPHCTIIGPVAHMAVLDPQTVWTWNAIGK